MANSRRNQEHLGIDTTVLVAYLDKDNPLHRQTEPLVGHRIALNPTVVHEAYHTLVFKMKWKKEEATKALLEASTDDENLFINQTLRTTKLALYLTVEHNTGGRDALILANFLGAGIPKLVTFDKDLLVLRKVKYGSDGLTIAVP